MEPARNRGAPCSRHGSYPDCCAAVSGRSLENHARLLFANQKKPTRIEVAGRTKMQLEAREDQETRGNCGQPEEKPREPTSHGVSNLEIVGIPMCKAAGNRNIGLEDEDETLYRHSRHVESRSNSPLPTKRGIWPAPKSSRDRVHSSSYRSDISPILFVLWSLTCGSSLFQLSCEIFVSGFTITRHSQNKLQHRSLVKNDR